MTVCFKFHLQLITLIAYQTTIMYERSQLYNASQKLQCSALCSVNIYGENADISIHMGDGDTASAKVNRTS